MLFHILTTALYLLVMGAAGMTLLLIGRKDKRDINQSDEKGEK